jgi:AraC-like DNA-binding protein
MPESKGHLNPGAPGVELERFEPDAALADLVRHIWLAHWRLPAGEVAHQRVLTYLLAGVAPAELVGRSRAVPDAPIDEIDKALSGPTPVPVLTALLSRWLGPLAARVDDRGRLVNRICRLAEENDTIVRVAELARHAGLSPRSLERLVVDHIGLTPKWLIECRRLQQAATTLHAHPDTNLTELALSLQYVDYAHFSRRYKAVIGETPDHTRTRRGVGD